MNRSGYYLGVLLRISYALALPIFAIAIIVIVYLMKPPPATATIAPVVVIEDGKPARLACDGMDGEFRPLAIVVAQDLAVTLLGAGSDKAAYAQMARLNARRIADGTDAAAKFGTLTAANLKQMDVQTLTFALAPTKTKFMPSKGGRDYYVLLYGQQITTKAQGREVKDVEVSVTLGHNRQRGDDGEVFKIMAFGVRDASQPPE